MNCADKKCNGGRGIKKQACMRRVCVLLQSNRQGADADDDLSQYGDAAQIPADPVLRKQPRPGQHVDNALTDVLESLFLLNKQPAAASEDARPADFPEAVRRALAPALLSDANALPAPPAQVVAKPSFVREPAPVPDCLPACKPPAPRLSRCGVCVACTAHDCGVCKNCRDKFKFGGRGIKKQACVRRVCLNMQEVKQPPIRHPQFYGAAKAAVWAAKAEPSEEPGSSSFEPCTGDRNTGATQSPVLLGTAPAGRPEDDRSASTTASTQGGYASSPRSLLPPLPPRQLDLDLLQRRLSAEDRSALLGDCFGGLSPKGSSSLNILSFVTAQAAAAASATDSVSVGRKRGRQPMFAEHEQPRDTDVACERKVRSWQPPSVEYVRRLARRPVKLDHKRPRSSPGFYAALLSHGRTTQGSASAPRPRTPEFKDRPRKPVRQPSVGLALVYERLHQRALAADA